MVVHHRHPKVSRARLFEVLGYRLGRAAPAGLSAVFLGAQDRPVPEKPRLSISTALCLHLQPPLGPSEEGSPCTAVAGAAWALSHALAVRDPLFTHTASGCPL